MGDPQVTLVVVPRERFSLTERSLQNFYENTTFPFRLVYVSAGTPARARLYLERESARRGFQLIHSNRYLAPNQARNLGLRHVTTKYVVFLDNDALVAPGWLDALVACAEDTGAWVVGPLYFIGEFEQQIIHMAGGFARFAERQGQRLLYDEHRLGDTPMAALPGPLQRGECDFAEFHCVLVRTDVFQRLGPLDEQLLSVHEHIDLGLAVRAAGGSVYFEPKAMATYVPPPPGAWSDLPYFMLRWSEAWNRASVRRFKEKWGVAGLRSTDDPADGDPQDSMVRWGRAYRRLFSGLTIPPDGTERPDSPLEQAQCMAALFQSVDRNSFDLALTTGDGDMVEEHASLSPQELLECLPGVLRKAEEGDLNVTLRPLLPERGNAPVLIRLDDLDEEGCAKVRPYAFLTLEVSDQAYQCWLAVARGASRSTAALRGLVGAAGTADGSAGTAPLAGSRNVNSELRHPDGSYPRVRLVEAHTGLLHTAAQLEGKGLLPYLWAGHVS